MKLTWLGHSCFLLEKDGYSGYISLEWEKTWHPELRDAREELPHFVRYIREHM